MDTFPAEEDLYTDSLLRFRVPEGSQVEVYKPGKKVWAKERTVSIISSTLCLDLEFRFFITFSAILWLSRDQPVSSSEGN